VVARRGTRARPRAIALAHTRRFIGDDRFATLPAALERDWQGDPARNPAIARTLAASRALRPAALEADWRIDLYRYRAVYDALVARRWAACGRSGRAALAKAGRTGSARRQRRARPGGRKSHPRHWRSIISSKPAARLWGEARMQLSVARYGASNWERGANLDRAMAD
jgi:hypothetical protein